MQVIKNRIVRVVLRALLFFFLFLLLLVGLVQFPYVQTRIATWLSEQFSEQTGYTLFIDRVNIDWFDKLAINGVGIYDPENNRLLNADRIDVDFSVQSLINRSNRNIDEVNIFGAELYLTKITVNDSVTTLNLNELVRRVKALIKKERKTQKYLSVDLVTVDNATFIYDDPTKDSLRGPVFDYHHFTLRKINGTFENLQSISDSLLLSIVNLNGYDDKTNLQIHDFRSDFIVSQQSMEFNGMSLKIGQSEFSDTVQFFYNGTYEMSQFNTKVRVGAHFDQTVIHSQDLALFAPIFRQYDDYYLVSGDFDGRVNNFNFTNANVTFGRNSTINGRIRMAGLPDFSETFIDFDLENSVISMPDLRNYVKPTTYQRLRPFTDIRFNSEFLGFPNDFVANGDFYTDYGRIESDINLKIEEDINKSTYKGTLSIDEFDLGGYTKEPLMGAVSVSGEVEGSGFTLESADFALNGFINFIDINNYRYTNITTDARFAKEFFEGYMNVDDPNLKLTTTGSIDLREGINLFNVRAQLDTAQLDALNISDEPFFVHTRLTVDATGLALDSIRGRARLNDTFVSYREESLQIDSIFMVSEMENNQRRILAETNLLSAELTGDFDPTVLYRDASNLWKEFLLNLKNNAEEKEAYYAAKQETPSNYNVQYSIRLNDTKPLLDVFYPDVTVAPNTSVSGRFISGFTSILSMQARPDTLRWRNNYLYESDIQLNLSKVSDSTNILAMAFVNSQEQSLEDIYTRDLFVEAIWDDNHIDFEADIDQVQFPNFARLQGSVDFLNGQTTIKLGESNISVLDKTWNFDPDNEISLRKNEVMFRNIKLSHLGERILIDGKLSRDPVEQLKINIDSVQIDILNTIINQQLDGTIDGYAEISEYYENLKINSRGSLTDFYVDDFLIGDLTGTNDWNNQYEWFETAINLERQSINILELTGTYQPNQETEQLRMQAELNGTNLKILEPFFKLYFTGIEGTATGIIGITGQLNNPFIRGEGIIEGGNVHVNYLNTDYAFEGNFFMEPDRIGFQRINLTDARGKTAFLSGIISHQNYRDYSMDIQGVLKEFTVMDTRAQDNDLFYGTGIASGAISFEGPVKNLSIIARARTDRGTRIYIPIGDTESFEQEEYITFMDFRDTTNINLEQRVEQIDLRGLKLDFDLEVTPAAYTEIIFDIKAGDIIRGRGAGDIKLQIDTKGDFNMFGDFEIQEGAYNFTLYNIINKEFEILPSSKISWYGDPYQGVLDIDATYNQLASFLPLLIQQESDDVYNESVELRRKYPVQVLLDIQGPLLSPNVDFDIVTQDLPRNIQVAERNVDLEFEFLRFKNSIDEQELKRQVFSLIVLRKFSPLQSFNTGGAISSSVSELLSNQLSYWITQVDENLEIDVDLGALDEEAFNTFQLRLSYTFLDGRLRVTRAGGFTNQQNKVDISSIAGDWTVEYLLTPDGKLKAKMYNRTNYNPINQTDDNRNTITTGFGLIYTQTFDEIRELFKKAKKAPPPLPEEEQQPDTDPLTLSNRDDESE